MLWGDAFTTIQEEEEEPQKRGKEEDKEEEEEEMEKKQEEKKIENDKNFPLLRPEKISETMMREKETGGTREGVTLKGLGM